MTPKTIAIIIYLAYIAVISLVTYILYGIDKKSAKRERRRIPERTLLLISIIGGALGGLLGMKRFRHKTAREHWYFTFINVVGVIIHLSLLVYIIIKA